MRDVTVVVTFAVDRHVSLEQAARFAGQAIEAKLDCVAELAKVCQYDLPLYAYNGPPVMAVMEG